MKMSSKSGYMEATPMTLTEVEGGADHSGGGEMGLLGCRGNSFPKLSEKEGERQSRSWCRDGVKGGIFF